MIIQAITLYKLTKQLRSSEPEEHYSYGYISRQDNTGRLIKDPNPRLILRRAEADNISIYGEPDYDYPKDMIEV